MSDRLTDVELAAIRERVERATDGPWWPHKINLPGLRDEGDWIIDSGPTFIASTQIDSERGERDAEFLAAARTDVPALLDEVGRMRAQVTSLTETVLATAGDLHGAEAEAERLRAAAVRTEQAETAIVAILEAERDEARARLDAVLALHRFDPATSAGGGHSDGCYYCQRPWPCPTVKAARGEAS